MVGIIGLGYVGLPLALAFAEAGLKVLGFDIQQRRVDLVNRGESYISDASSERLLSAVNDGLLAATTEQQRLSEVDCVCICVPTPLTRTKEPDLSSVIKETRALSRHLRQGQLVVLESTTYPGTTEDVVFPILERSGLKCGTDFYLAYSPERLDPGNRGLHFKNTPKIVAGIDPHSTELAHQLYAHIAEVIFPVSSPRVAEMTKVFENVFRSVNIALVNEMAQLCERMGISIWEVIDAASTKPYGFMPFHPGPGVGGHCIPLDPYYLASKAREYDFHTRFIELAGEINESMPYYVVSRIADALNEQGKSLKDSRILVLGVTYKRDVADLRESPALKLIHLLVQREALVMYNDPYIAARSIPVEGATAAEVSEDVLSSSDCVVIATDHSCYDYQYIARHARMVFDTRGVTRGLKRNNVVRLGE